MIATDADKASFRAMQAASKTSAPADKAAPMDKLDADFPMPVPVPVPVPPHVP